MKKLMKTPLSGAMAVNNRKQAHIGHIPEKVHPNNVTVTSQGTRKTTTLLQGEHVANVNVKWK
jgi:hypothetical protein